jgi:hypothetical protein
MRYLVQGVFIVRAESTGEVERLMRVLDVRLKTQEIRVEGLTCSGIAEMPDDEKSGS